MYCSSRGFFPRAVSQPLDEQHEEGAAEYLFSLASRDTQLVGSAQHAKRLRCVLGNAQPCR